MANEHNTPQDSGHQPLPPAPWDPPAGQPAQQPPPNHPAGQSPHSYPTDPSPSSPHTPVPPAHAPHNQPSPDPRTQPAQAPFGQPTAPTPGADPQNVWAPPTSPQPEQPLDGSWQLPANPHLDGTPPAQAPTEPAVDDIGTFDPEGLFRDNRGSRRMMEILRDPDVQDIRCNRHDRIFFNDSNGAHLIDRVFAGPEQYREFIDDLMRLTDVGYPNLEAAQKRTSVIEGSFRGDLTSIRGSIIVVTSDLSRGEPCLVVRKQPEHLITLDQMLEQGMMDLRMRTFLEAAVRGRLNILVSGSSGAGKTTLARALSWYIDPDDRVLTAEEIDELHLSQRLPNVVALTTYRQLDEQGRVIREERLEDLVVHALRMRADRVWVGETRGKEAYALVKACLSGHDGSVTTIHADTAAQAVRQLVSYVMESHLTEEVARDQIAEAFHLAVQIRKGSMGRRVITEIVELEAVREGNEQRRNVLFTYDAINHTWQMVGQPTNRIIEALERYGVNYEDVARQIALHGGMG